MSHLPFSTIELTFIAIYLLSLVGIGVLGLLARRDNSLQDFYLAGPGIGFWVLLLTLYATQYSGNTLFGFSGAAYQRGFLWLVSIQFMIMMVITFLTYAPTLHYHAKRRGYITPTDYIQDRFQSPLVSLTASMIMIVALANYLLAQLKAMGSALQGFAGDNPQDQYQAYVFGVLVLALVIVVYETLGGFRAVAWTDVLQGSVLVLGFSVLVILVVQRYGSLESATRILQETAPQKTAPPDGYGVMTWISWIVLVGIGGGLYPQAIQRMFAARDARTLRRSFLVMAFMPLTTTLVVTLFGVIAAAYVPGDDAGARDEILTVVCSQVHAESVLGAWLVTILFAGILAALMSTADSVLLCISSMLVKDFYARLRPEASDRELTRTGKLCSWVLIAVMALLAIAAYDFTLVKLLKIKFEILIQIAPAFILGVHWPGLQKRALLAGIAAGLLVAAPWAITAAVADVPGMWLGVHAGAWGLLANLAVLGAVSGWQSVRAPRDLAA
ncbi:sodium:solute symporter family protein [Lignipirellula cremea]|uniref:Sodium/pantothenate symporter n=1 Tax=Lignipirellula cremea TaxID=2528010 RepID=A0A518DRH4_9BACT|nr:sodium:solute symporter family protein [Lignipirellula cremea]QDU94445.1 Sodium/pantothenate symporter [Lignipirellula cremea]